MGAGGFLKNASRDYPGGGWEVACFLADFISNNISVNNLKMKSYQPQRLNSGQRQNSTNLLMQAQKVVL